MSGGLEAIRPPEKLSATHDLVHAISAAAKRFYEGCGFISSPIDPLTVMITVAEAAKMLGETDRG